MQVSLEGVLFAEGEQGKMQSKAGDALQTDPMGARYTTELVPP